MIYLLWIFDISLQVCGTQPVRDTVPLSRELPRADCSIVHMDWQYLAVKRRLGVSRYANLPH
jgi:hypothetical protein